MDFYFSFVLSGDHIDFFEYLGRLFPDSKVVEIETTE